MHLPAGGDDVLDDVRRKQEVQVVRIRVEGGDGAAAVDRGGNELREGAVGAGADVKLREAGRATFNPLRMISAVASS